MRLLSFLVVLIFLSGCGGFRGGIESAPYVGDAAPVESPSRPLGLHEVVLPEFTLQLSVNNSLQTYQYEVMLFVIPTYFNFWDEFRNRDAGALELSLQVAARDQSVTFDPRQLMLIVDGKKVRPSGLWVNNLERERQVIDAYVKARDQASSDHPPAVPRASHWRDAVTESVTMSPGEKSPRFIVTFPLPLISPEKDFSLNINPAIVWPMPSNVPLIHFKSARWSDGYS